MSTVVCEVHPVFNLKMMKRSRFLIFSLLLVIFPGLAGADEEETGVDSPVIATVGDTKITEAEKDDLGSVVLSVLLEQYAKDEKIVASDEEVEKFLAGLRDGEAKEKVSLEKQRSELIAELKSDDLGKEQRAEKSAELASLTESLKEPSDTERKEIEGLRREMADGIIKSWKINKALFDQYGGRVVYQQFGPEPLDAYRKFLEAKLKAGAFQLSDKKYEDDLWRIYRDDELHDFVPEGERETVLNTPPWDRQEEADSGPGEE